MLQVPHDIGDRFEAAMQSASIASDLRPHFRRWLRFYLDFCAKYGFDPANGSSFRQFNTKLQDKGQVEWKRRQAHEAIVLYIRSGVGGATGGNLQGKKDAQEVATPVRSATNVSKNASEGMLCSIPFVQAWGKRRMSGRGAAIAPQSINVRGRLENALSASNIKSSWTAMTRNRGVKVTGFRCPEPAKRCNFGSWIKTMRITVVNCQPRFVDLLSATAPNTNSVEIALAKDAKIIAEQDSVVRRHYGAKLVMMNIGDTFTTGPTEAAYVVNEQEDVILYDPNSDNGNPESD